MVSRFIPELLSPLVYGVQATVATPRDGRGRSKVRDERKHQDRENLVPAENIGNRFASLPNVRGECHAGFEYLNSFSEKETP
jgi:hypothetical protein